MYIYIYACVCVCLHPHYFQEIICCPIIPIAQIL